MWSSRTQEKGKASRSLGLASKTGSCFDPENPQPLHSSLGEMGTRNTDLSTYRISVPASSSLVVSNTNRENSTTPFSSSINPTAYLQISLLKIRPLLVPHLIVDCCWGSRCKPEAHHPARLPHCLDKGLTPTTETRLMSMNLELGVQPDHHATDGPIRIPRPAPPALATLLPAIPSSTTAKGAMGLEVGGREGETGVVNQPSSKGRDILGLGNAGTVPSGVMA